MPAAARTVRALPRCASGHCRGRVTIGEVQIHLERQWEGSCFRSGGNRNGFGYRARADAQYLLNHLYLDVYAQNAHELRADVAEIARLLTERASSYGVSGELKYSSRTSFTFNAAALKTA